MYTSNQRSCDVGGLFYCFFFFYCCAAEVEAEAEVDNPLHHDSIVCKLGESRDGLHDSPVHRCVLNQRTQVLSI